MMTLKIFEPEAGAARRPGADPQGMVLVFALIILFLMTLMGAAILSNSRTELNISSNSGLSRNAFAMTDAAARIATLMSRILLHQDELGDPRNILKSSGGKDPKFMMDVEINDDKFNLASLRREADEYKLDSSDPNPKSRYATRYVRAGRSDLDASSSHSEAPHLVFKVDKQTVATASITFDHQEAVSPGTSLGGNDFYDNGSGATMQIVMVISVNGRALSNKPDDKPGKGGFDAGDKTDDETATADEARSVITTIFREMM